MPARLIPNYELYGEQLAGGYTDPVHHEELRERSSRHHWTIRLHRHARMAQIFLFRSPGVQIRLAEDVHVTQEPTLLFVPPGVAHGFRFAEEATGDVLSLLMGEVGPEVARLMDHPAMQGGGLVGRAAAANFDHVDTAFGQLRDVYHRVTIERVELLQALTRLIVTYVSGDLRRQVSVGPVGRAVQPSRHEAQADRFCLLIEELFPQDLAVGDYAARMGVSAPHLTRVCRRILGASPHELIRQRRLLEGKRLLRYTRLPIAEIAERSGFRDPSFFSRSFARAFGSAPRDYRHEKDG